MLADRVGARQTEGKPEFDSEFDVWWRLGGADCVPIEHPT